MKKILLILLLLCNLISYGQMTEMLVDTNKLWSNLWQTSSGGPPPYILQTTFIKFSGDTLIGSNHFKKVLESTDHQQINYTIKGYIREDSTNKVFYRSLEDSVSRLIYDFKAEVGDSIHIGVFFGSITLVVDSIDTVFIHGQYLKRMILSHYGCSGEQWIEGIGSLCGVISSGTYCIEGVKYDLLCYFEKDTLKYSNPDYPDCFYNNVGITNIESGKIKVNIFPNPVSSTSILNIESKTENDFILEVYSINGILINSILIKSQQIFISKNDYVSGLYIYRLIVPDGDILNGKFIVE